MTPPPSPCQHHRSTLSAVLDGEAKPDEVAAVEAHLVTCAACTSYRRRLEDLSALVARSPAPPTPDLVAAVVAVDPAPAAPVRHRDRPSLARYLLGAVAAAQIALGLPALVLGQGGGEVHTSRHLGAWAVAFGVGLLLAAARPRHARTLLPVAATLSAAVAVTMVVDVVAGDRTAAPEAGHLLELVGLGLLALVHRRAGHDTGGLGTRRAMPLLAGGA